MRNCLFRRCSVEEKFIQSDTVDHCIIFLHQIQCVCRTGDFVKNQRREFKNQTYCCKRLGDVAAKRYPKCCRMRFDSLESKNIDGYDSKRQYDNKINAGEKEGGC